MVYTIDLCCGCHLRITQCSKSTLEPTEVSGVSPVLHEDLHLVGGAQRSRGVAAESEHDVDVRPHVDVSLSDEVPPSTALWNYMNNEEKC